MTMVKTHTQTRRKLLSRVSVTASPTPLQIGHSGVIGERNRNSASTKDGSCGSGFARSMNELAMLLLIDAPA
jgi:hypothetical protein